MAPNWWSLEYETAASGTTQQYKGKNVKGRALVAKASGPGFESPATTKIFSHFSFAFSRPF